MKIAIGADHGGYKLKEEIKKYLEEKEIEYINDNDINLLNQQELHNKEEI